MNSETEIKLGDRFYYHDDDHEKHIRKIKIIRRGKVPTFEWNYGWAYLSELEPNPNYPKKSRVKWIKK